MVLSTMGSQNKGREMGRHNSVLLHNNRARMAAVPDHATLLPDVPLSDVEAWNAYAEWRWIYHKTEVAAAQGVPCGVMPDEPPSYPVVLKPITNMYGMGWQACVLESRSDYHKHWGHTGMWMPFFGWHSSGSRSVGCDALPVTANKVGHHRKCCKPCIGLSPP